MIHARDENDVPILLLM